MFGRKINLFWASLSRHVLQKDGFHSALVMEPPRLDLRSAILTMGISKSNCEKIRAKPLLQGCFHSSIYFLCNSIQSNAAPVENLRLMAHQEPRSATDKTSVKCNVDERDPLNFRCPQDCSAQCKEIKTKYDRMRQFGRIWLLIHKLAKGYSGMK